MIPLVPRYITTYVRTTSWPKVIVTLMMLSHGKGLHIYGSLKHMHWTHTKHLKQLISGQMHRHLRSHSHGLHMCASLKHSIGGTQKHLQRLITGQMYSSNLHAVQNSVCGQMPLL